MPIDTKKILQLIVKDKSLVKEHSNWGDYIQVALPEIHKVGLIHQTKNTVRLSFHFGNSQSQSRAFYDRNPSVDHLKGDKWIVYGDFHLAGTRGQNLIWFETELTPKGYIAFWERHKNLLYQRHKTEILSFLTDLKEMKVIDFGKDKAFEFQESIYKKDYNVFNICAGLAVLYEIDVEDIKRLQSEDKLKQFLLEKISQALRVTHRELNEFYKQTDEWLNFSGSEEEGDPDGL